MTSPFRWLRRQVRNCRIGLANLWHWFPVIWRDRNWDHVWILVMLVRKLRLTAQHIEHHQNYEGWEPDGARIRQCARLFERVALYDFDGKSEDAEAEEEAVWSRACDIWQKHLRDWWD